MKASRARAECGARPNFCVFRDFRVTSFLRFPREKNLCSLCYLCDLKTSVRSVQSVVFLYNLRLEILKLQTSNLPLSSLTSPPCSPHTSLPHGHDTGDVASLPPSHAASRGCTSADCASPHKPQPPLPRSLPRCQSQSRHCYP